MGLPRKLGLKKGQKQGILADFLFSGPKIEVCGCLMSSVFFWCPTHLVENGAELGKNGTFFGFLVGAPRVLE